MNKLNPASVANNFDSEMDALLAYHSRATAAFVGSATAASDISLMNEQVFLFAAIAFEGTLSDLFFAYVNRDSSIFVAAKEQQIKKHVAENFGSWYSSKVSIPHPRHVSAEELHSLLDPRGFNVTFQNTRRMVAQARRNLLPAYAAKYRSISPAQRKLADCAKHVRNYIAHRSDSGFHSMTAALASLSTGPYAVLSRRASYRVNSVGAYLKAWTGNESRTELFVNEMKGMVGAIGR